MLIGAADRTPTISLARRRGRCSFAEVRSRAACPVNERITLSGHGASAQVDLVQKYAAGVADAGGVQLQAAGPVSVPAARVARTRQPSFWVLPAFFSRRVSCRKMIRTVNVNGRVRIPANEIDWVAVEVGRARPARASRKIPPSR
jgi:hypothetical protein